MSLNGGRKKKLVVAFHFQYSDQAAWKCDACRKSGLEQKRRCGWVDIAAALPETVVWAKGNAIARSCPKSYITSQSLAWVEEFWMWKLFGGGNYLDMPARAAEAFGALEAEWVKAQSGLGHTTR